MTKITRRQLVLSGGALLSAGLVPNFSGLISSSYAQKILRNSPIIRAGSNENPYGPSRLALQAISEAMDLTNQYGGGNRDNLMKLIAEINGVSTDHVVLGTGSSEILKTGGLIASWDKGSVVCADPTYQDLVRYAGKAKSEIIRVPVDENLYCDLNAMHKAIRPDTSMVYLVNPNNPLPNIIDKTELRDFVLDVSKERLVFVDEVDY